MVARFWAVTGMGVNREDYGGRSPNFSRPLFAAARGLPPSPCSHEQMQAGERNCSGGGKNELGFGGTINLIVPLGRVW